MRRFSPKCANSSCRRSRRKGRSSVSERPPGYAWLCRGGSSSLTFPAVHQRSSNVSSHSHETLYQELRRHLGEVFRRLALQKELKVEEGHLMPDHVHMLLSIPPKYAVSQVVGFIKGKSAIHMARVYGERKRNFVGQHFWARGFFVNTVGRDEEAIRAYIRNQEKEDQRLEQMNLWR